jgi:type I restriction enzyme, S subunit
MSILPDTWKACSFGDVVEYGSTIKVEPDAIPSDAWVLELEDIEKDTSKVLQRLTCGQRQSKSTKNRFSAGDVLYGKLRPYLNKVIHADEGGFCTTEIIPLKPPDWLAGRYLFYWLKHPDFLEYVSAESHGLNMPRLGTEAGRRAPFVLAPINEQRRIAEKLDAMITRVDACRERLGRVPAIVKRFRESVLNAATSGELTEDWRAERWPISAWPLVRLVDLGELERGKSRHRPRNDPRLYGGPYPFIQTGAIAQSRGHITEHDQTYSEIGLAQSRLWPAGTLCITIAANIADTAILTYPACFPDSVVGFIADPSRCAPEFVKWSIDVVKERLASFAPATAQKNINLAVLNDVQFRCPALDEQIEIIRRVESLFAYADRLEARYQSARALVDRLTPALLAKAFRGELVPQDPNDEPAALLLERIRVARAADLAKPRKSARGRRSIKLRTAEAIMLTREDIASDHLSAILTERGPLTAEALWSAAQLGIDDFYDQLKDEEARGLLRERPGNSPAAPRLLEVAT